MKKWCLLILLLFPLTVNATQGQLKQKSIVECDNIKYGYHGSDYHYHRAILRDGIWYADGEEVTLPCENKTIENVKKEVSFSGCIDGDTAKFIVDGEEKSVRFLAINTPEIGNKAEKFGEESATFTCQKLKNASKIELEFDSKSDEVDKYGRILAFVWVDDELIQKQLIEEGLAEVKYIYDNYKYVEELQQLEKKAQEKKCGMWGNYKKDNSEMYITLGAIIIALIIFFMKKK